MAGVFRKVAGSIAIGALSLVLIVFAYFWISADFREIEKLGVLPSQGGQLVATDEGVLYTLARGLDDNIPVVFTHGTAAWSGLWLPTLEHIASHQYHAIGYDMPPFGFSAHAKDRDYSRKRQAERFLALLKTIKRKPIVVAHSFSGDMVAEAAMTDSTAFAGIVFVDAAIGLNSHVDPTNAPFILKSAFVRKAAAAVTTSNPYLTGTFLRQFIHIKSAATPSAIAILKQPMLRVGYTDAVSDWLPNLLQSPRNAMSTHEKNWRKLNLPISFIWGDQDTITPLDQADALMSLLPNADLTVLPGIGHIPQIEAPELFQTQLVKVLKKLAINANLRGSL